MSIPQIARYHRGPSPRRLRLTIVGLLIGLVAAACGGSGETEYVPAGIVRSPAPSVGELSLPDVTNGEDLAFRAAEDDVLIIYFGYTSCPDVCPTTMADLRKAVRELGDDGERIGVAMATVDPDRDSPEVLTAYVHTFFPDGVALRTEDAAALSTAADAFGASYDVTTNDEGYVEVVHTAFLYAVDDQGLVRLTWPFGIESEDISRDLQVLLERTDSA